MRLSGSKSRSFLVGLIAVAGSCHMHLRAQTVIWTEDFSGYPNLTMNVPGLWTTQATDMDDPGLNSGNVWGTDGGEFHVNDVEGPAFSNENYFTTRNFDVSAFTILAVSATYRHQGSMECGGGPNSADIIRFEYSADNGPWVLWGTNGLVCGSNNSPGAASSDCIVADSLRIRITCGNKANNESYFFDNIEIVGFNPPEVTFPNDTSFCEGETVMLQSTGAQSYAWTSPEPLACPTCGTVSITADSSTYVLLTAIDSAGCPHSDSIRITELELVEAQLGNDTSLCPGETLALPVQNGQAWTWSTGAITSSIQLSDTSGVFWVQVSSVCGNDTDSIALTLLPDPIADLGNDTLICNAAWALTLDGGEGDTYRWSTNEFTETITVGSTGQYWVEVRTSCGVESDTMIVTATLPPDLDLVSDTVVCENATVWLDASTPQASYTWSTGNSESIQQITAPGVYSVTVTNVCGSDIASSNFEFTPLPSEQLNDTTISCASELSSLTLRAEEGPDFQYVWSTGSTTPSITVDESGTYFVEVTGCGVTIRDFVAVEFGGIAGAPLSIPDVFTPNGDNMNDQYRVPEAEERSFLSFDVLILNRWGREVYESSDPLFRWDGKAGGNEVETGTYFVVVRYKDACDPGQEQVYKGTFTLLR